VVIIHPPLVYGLKTPGSFGRLMNWVSAKYAVFLFFVGRVYLGMLTDFMRDSSNINIFYGGEILIQKHSQAQSLNIFSHVVRSILNIGL
jgi:hypothetical protein